MHKFLMFVAMLTGVAFGQTLSEQAFLGLGLRDSVHGPIVSWVYPGPFGGTGFGSSTGVQRSDNVDAVYVGDTIAPETRQEIKTVAAFDAIVESLAVGDTFSIEIRRSPDANMNASVPIGGEGGERETITVTVADRDSWMGTIGRSSGDEAFDELDEGEFEAFILSEIDTAGLNDEPGGVDALLDLLKRTVDGSRDPNMVPSVVQAFHRPFSLDEISADLGGLARRVGRSPTAANVRELIETALGVSMSMDEPSPDDEALYREQAENLVRTMRDSVYIYNEHAADHIAVIRESPTKTSLWIGSSIRGLEALGLHRAYDANEADWVTPTDEVRALVEGDLVAMRIEADGTIAVVGGPGPNVYDMAGIDHVLDVGGNDEYRWSKPPVRARTRSFVVDRGGDDRYVSTAAFVGPGVGSFGLSVVEDYGGDDVYESAHIGSLGFGLFGVGMIIDHAGDDHYSNLGPDSGWSIGSGFYGVGLVIDRNGADVYAGEKLVQGAAGARGFGAVIDASGDDRYTANGPNFGSVYGTADVFVGMSQGFGMGIRGYAAGGLGALWDLGGDDRYEAGEFSQACGYYFGIGLVHDFDGADEYVGNRYGQGTGAHQAVGILLDVRGDDVYRSMTAASQGGTWDQTIGYLIDRDGNDTYEADGLAQGSAAMQAIGLLIDLRGDDTYRAKGASIQGRGGSNTYHYDAQKVFSFSGLFDFGGEDSYSSGRENGVMTRFGELNESSPGASQVYGLFDDQP